MFRETTKSLRRDDISTSKGTKIDIFSEKVVKVQN